MDYQLIIPMSGKGTRFRQAGYQELKPFILVEDRPIIQYILEMYPNRTRTIFVVNSTDPELDEHNQILLGLSPEAEIVVMPDNRLGPSYAVAQASLEIDQDMATVVNYADFAGVWNEKDFISALVENDACILTYTGFHPHMLRNTKYAYVKTTNNLVTDIQEKMPYTDFPMEEEASAGAYAFKNGSLLLSAIRRQIENNLDLNGEFYTSLTMKPLIEEGKRISTVRMNKFYQWGTPEDLEEWKYWRCFFKNFNQNGISLGEKNNHDFVILAGGKGTRLSKSTSTPKALFPIKNKQLWEYSISKNTSIRNYLFMRPEYIPLVNKNTDVEIIPLSKETKGQAETANVALEHCSTLNGGISFLSCDNIILDLDLSKFELSSEQDILFVWVADKYQNAKNQPDQFSWVEVSKSGKITGYFPKQNPPNDDCKTVIGNFTFSNKYLANRALSYCMKAVNYINQEPYLDSSIRFAIENNIEIAAIDVENFAAIGTSLELQTFNYWSECAERGYIAWTEN